MFSKYRYVYEIYREKSFTKAAEKLFISQPSLSAAIKKIETQLGAPLFERSTSSIKLTEIGREYISAAEKIISVENEFRKRTEDIYNLKSGSILVGGTNYLCSYVLPEIINRFTSEHPDIDVTLTEANSTTLCDMIDKEKLDIIIDSFDEPMSMYDGVPLLQEKILLCVPQDNEINNKFKQFQIYPEQIYNDTVNIDLIPSVPIKEFEKEKFILLKAGNDMNFRAMNLFENEKVSPDVIFSVDQLNISYILAESGMGCCFITDTLFKYGKFHKNVVLYNVGAENSSRTLYIAHKKNKYCTKAMSVFIKTAADVMKA